MCSLTFKNAKALFEHLKAHQEIKMREVNSQRVSGDNQLRKLRNQALMKKLKHTVLQTTNEERKHRDSTYPLKNTNADFRGTLLYRIDEKLAKKKSETKKANLMKR